MPFASKPHRQLFIRLMGIGALGVCIAFWCVAPLRAQQGVHAGITCFARESYLQAA